MEVHRPADLRPCAAPIRGCHASKTGSGRGDARPFPITCADNDGIMCAYLAARIRIKARAVRRMGELAKTIEQKRGGDRKSNGRAPTPLTPREMARRQAELSPHQLKQAIRVANVPREQ